MFCNKTEPSQRWKDTGRIIGKWTGLPSTHLDDKPAHVSYLRRIFLRSTLDRRVYRIETRWCIDIRWSREAPPFVQRIFGMLNPLTAVVWEWLKYRGWKGYEFRRVFFEALYPRWCLSQFARKQVVDKEEVVDGTKAIVDDCSHQMKFILTSQVKANGVEWRYRKGMTRDQ